MPRSRTTRGLAAVTRTAPPAATANAAAAAADPPQPPPSGWRWGSCMPRGVQNFTTYVCMCVCLRVFNFSDASFKTFGLIFNILIGAAKIKN